MFKECNTDSYNLKEKLEAYLSSGFALKALFSYISIPNTKEDYVNFLELIFEVENDRNNFSKEIGFTKDPNTNEVRGFSLELRHSLFGPECTLDTKYTFDDYVNELSKYFGSQIDVRNFLAEIIKDVDEENYISKLRHSGTFEAGYQLRKYQKKVYNKVLSKKPWKQPVTFTLTEPLSS